MALECHPAGPASKRSQLCGTLEGGEFYGATDTRSKVWGSLSMVEAKLGQPHRPQERIQSTHGRRNRITYTSHSPLAAQGILGQLTEF